MCDEINWLIDWTAMATDPAVAQIRGLFCASLILQAWQQLIKLELSDILV